MEEQTEYRGIERTGSSVLPSVTPQYPSPGGISEGKDGKINRDSMGKKNKKLDKYAKREKEKQIIRKQLRLQTNQKGRPHTTDHQDTFLRTTWIAEEIRRTEPASVKSMDDDSGKWYSKRHPPVNMDGPALRLKLIYKNGMRVVDNANRRKKDRGPDVQKEIVKIGRGAIESFDARTGMDVSDLASLDPYTFCAFHV